MSENRLDLKNMYRNGKIRWMLLDDSDLAKVDPEKLSETERCRFSEELENRLAYKYQNGRSQYSTLPAPRQGKEDVIPEGAILCYQQNKCEDINPKQQYIIIDRKYIHNLSFLDIVDRTSREFLTPEGRIDWGKWNNISKYGAISVESFETELENLPMLERNRFDVESSPASKDFFKKIPYAGYDANTIIVFNKDLITYKRPIDNIKETLETFRTCIEEKQKHLAEMWEEKYITSLEDHLRNGMGEESINKDDDRR